MNTKLLRLLKKQAKEDMDLICNFHKASLLDWIDFHLNSSDKPQDYLEAISEYVEDYHG